MSLDNLVMQLPKDNRDRLFSKLQRLRMYTDYSGSGQPEHAAARIWDCLAASMDPPPHQHAGPRCIRASDIDENCRKVLCAFPGDMCVLGDIVQRQGVKFGRRLESIVKNAQNNLGIELKRANSDEAANLVYERSRTRWLRSVKRLIEANASDDDGTAWCDKHGKECPIYKFEPLDSESTPLRVIIAGISCIDWSSRGSQRKTLGKGALAWASLMREIVMFSPDAVILECTRQYRHEDINEILGQRYDMWPITFSPTEVGVPSERYRKYMVLLQKHGRLSWTPSAELTLETFLGAFGRRLASNGHVYLADTPEHVVEAEASRWAARRHLPPKDADGKRLAFEDLLTRKAVERMQSWQTLLESNGYSGDDEMMFDISQNAKFGHLTDMVPAITRKNCPWSHCLRRPLTLEEKLEVQGYPILAAEATLGVTLPWSTVFDRVPRGALASMAGNAMHLVAIGLTLAYTLACTQDSTCKQPPIEEKPVDSQHAHDEAPVEQ